MGISFVPAENHRDLVLELEVRGLQAQVAHGRVGLRHFGSFGSVHGTGGDVGGTVPHADSIRTDARVVALAIDRSFPWCTSELTGHLRS